MFQIHDGLDFGRRIYSVGPRQRPVLLIDARTATITAACWAATACVAVLSLLTGSASVSIAEAVGALLGRGDPYTTMIVVEWRAPRILMAVLLGVVLSMSGSIFQNLTANPLGSPDVIGFQTGSYTGALVVMLIIGGGSTATMVGALLGGVATALAVFLLASKSGFAGGVRLVIVGIAVSAMLASVNVWILLTASVEDAIMASLWGAGNLAGTSWSALLLAASGSIVFIAGAVALARPMRLMQIGLPFATALGQNVRRVQIAAIITGIGLTALATATAGPISFIALAAPQIARRLVRDDGLALAPTAAVGSLLLLLADTVAQRINPESPLPVGIVTVSIGGIYFLWLLLREGRKK
ncbi:FecCD family ABC transporter permease [Corynebacterium pacaense]|uniref:FecCD family ABC transporter permease n=1 Tax=Corynebacterium pacaense TaxID=1816684 RepID=UPI0009BB2CEB|nr:iron chelate uptake ABC transporter family permease subunit [Corynebacterium pacaense]